jgi:hypothetical protein
MQKNHPQENEMEPQATKDSHLVGGIVLIVFAFLASAAVLDYRKKKKTLPSFKDFGSDLDLAEFDHDDFPDRHFAEPEDLYAFNRFRLRAYQARTAAPQTVGCD